MFVLPHCLGEQDGDATLHVTANPYASSLLSPSADYAKYYCEVMLSGELDGVDVQGAYYDALYAKENEVVGAQPVRMRSLDSLAAEGALPLGRLPDFLSLDTQGSEHAILSGARSVIGRSVLAIATEVEFHPMYDRQPLFSAMLDLANECGFHFAGFTYLQEISPHHAPVGQRAKGFVAFGDAIFLRYGRWTRRARLGDGVAGVRQEGQVPESVLDLGPVVELRAADDLIADAVADERVLQDARLRVRPIEDRDLVS